MKRIATVLLALLMALSLSITGWAEEPEILETPVIQETPEIQEVPEIREEAPTQEPPEIRETTGPAETPEIRESPKPAESAKPEKKQEKTKKKQGRLMKLPLLKQFRLKVRLLLMKAKKQKARNLQFWVQLLLLLLLPAVQSVLSSDWT